MMKLAKLDDLNVIYQIDKKFYKDNFFTRNKLKDIILGKSRNKLYISENKQAYIMIFKMPDKSIYITSLAGVKCDRARLLLKLLNKYKNTDRIYTHAKQKWGTDLLVEFGFNKKNKGNQKHELVKFNDDISKLWVYEYRNK